MEKRRNGFYDKDIDMILDPFRTFDFANVSSWAEIELWAGINGVRIEPKLVYTLLAGTRVFDNLHGAFVYTLAQTDFLDEYANSIEFVENLFKIYDESGLALSDPMGDFCKWLRDNSIQYAFGTEGHTLKKYELLRALDSRFPYILVKFYDRRKYDLHRFDQQFIKWLTLRLAEKSKNDKTFMRLYSAFSSEAQKQQETRRFLN